MTIKYDGSQLVTGWNCDSDDVEVKGKMGPEGYVDRYYFVMPEHDVSITPIMKTASRHTIEYEHCEGVKNVTLGVDLYGGTLYTEGPIKNAHEGNAFTFYPEYKEGYHVSIWMTGIKSTDGTKDINLEKYMNDDGTLTLVMPDADIIVYPVYEEDYPK